jgi:hypothetical protein
MVEKNIVDRIAEYKMSSKLEKVLNFAGDILSGLFPGIEYYTVYKVQKVETPSEIWTKKRKFALSESALSVGFKLFLMSLYSIQPSLDLYFLYGAIHGLVLHTHRDILIKS